MEEADARKRLAEDRKLRDKSLEQANALSSSKPTPTQEENDLAKLGVTIEEHEHDGGPGEITYEMVRRQAEPSKPAGAYQTRQATVAERSTSERQTRERST